MSKQAAIEEAMREFLHDLVFSPEIPIVDNAEQEYEPTMGQEYLEAQWLPGETGTPFVTQGSKQYIGILQVTVVFPRNSGVQLALLIADEVVDHFEQGTIIDGNDVRVKITRQPSIGSPTPEAAWLRIPVSVPYNILA